VVRCPVEAEAEAFGTSQVRLALATFADANKEAALHIQYATHQTLSWRYRDSTNLHRFYTKVP
jgi:hypothetical protein